MESLELKNKSIKNILRTLNGYVQQKHDGDREKNQWTWRKVNRNYPVLTAERKETEIKINRATGNCGTKKINIEKLLFMFP